MTEQLLNFFGRFHPLVVHLPIGILLLAFLFEGISLFRKYRKLRGAVQASLFIGALAAIVSAITGYLLSLEGGYESSTLTIHQYLGMATAILAIGLYYLRRHKWILNQERKKDQPIRFLLFIPLILLLTITGHYGGSLTHGEEFITEFVFYSEKGTTDPITKLQSISNMQDAILYADVIQPILESKCYSCHSASKQKGDLRLDGVEMIMKGGKHGAVIKNGLADSSSLFSRLMLPLEDKHHMPPNEKPQPGSSEIDLIRLWINEGAMFDQKIAEINQPEKASEYIKLIAESLNEKNWVPDGEVPMASVNSIRDLKDAGAVVVPIGEGQNYLSVNFTNKRSLDQPTLDKLRAIKEQLVSLRLSYCQLTDKDLSFLKNFDNLIWLYLDHTNATDSTIFSLDLPNLKYLNIVFTPVTDKALPQIRKFKSLEQVFVYKSDITSKGIQELAKSSPGVKIDSGSYQLPKLPTDTIFHKKKS